MNSDAVGTTTIKAILWHPPIQACASMATTFLDRQLPRGDIDRHVRITLRAIPKFHNRLCRANVKVAVEYDNGIKTHFAQCVVFLKDSQENFL
jgi:hypothetical protein